MVTTAGDRATDRAPRTTIAALAAACHPGPTVVVTALATALAAGAGGGPARTALVGAAVLAGQLSIGWSNDWLDAERDLAVSRADKPVVQGRVSPVTLRRAALGAVVVCLVLSLALGPAAAAAHAVTVAGGWAYNVRLKATVWSWLPYAAAFGALPAFVVLALPGSASPAPWGVAAGALLGVGAHLANVLPDLEDDAATGVRGLPHRLGRRGASVAAPLALVAAVPGVVLGPPGGPGPVAAVVGGLAAVLAVAAGAVAVTRTGSRLPFTLSMAVAAVCVGLLVAAGAELVRR